MSDLLPSHRFMPGQVLGIHDSLSCLSSSPGRDPFHKAGEETSSASEFTSHFIWAQPNYPAAMSSTHRLISHDSRHNNFCRNSWSDSWCCASRIHCLKSDEIREGLIGCVDYRACPRDLMARVWKAFSSQLQMFPTQKCGGFPVCREPRCLL